jgi:hypothetical protein
MENNFHVIFLNSAWNMGLFMRGHCYPHHNKLVLQKIKKQTIIWVCLVGLWL